MRTKWFVYLVVRRDYAEKDGGRDGEQKETKGKQYKIERN